MYPPLMMTTAMSPRPSSFACRRRPVTDRMLAADACPLMGRPPRSPWGGTRRPASRRTWPHRCVSSAAEGIALQPGSALPRAYRSSASSVSNSKGMPELAQAPGRGTASSSGSTPHPCRRSCGRYSAQHPLPRLTRDGTTPRSLAIDASQGPGDAACGPHCTWLARLRSHARRARRGCVPRCTGSGEEGEGGPRAGRASSAKIVRPTVAKLRAALIGGIPPHLDHRAVRRRCLARRRATRRRSQSSGLPSCSDRHLASTTCSPTRNPRRHPRLRRRRRGSRDARIGQTRRAPNGSARRWSSAPRAPTAPRTPT